MRVRVRVGGCDVPPFLAVGGGGRGSPPTDRPTPIECTHHTTNQPPHQTATPSALPTATATTNDPTPAAAPAAEEAPTKKPTWKDMLKKHGPVFLIYWNGMWLLSGLTIYAGLTLGGIDPLPLAYAVNLDRLIDLSRLDPAHGNVAVAIVLNEAAELVRFPLVVATVPRVTRWWEGVRPEWLKPKLGPGTCGVVWCGVVWCVLGCVVGFEGCRCGC